MAKKILVVDDEPSIVNLVKVKLTSEGFNVVTASNGEEALRQVALEKPDGIVLDVMMPKMDGWEVAKRLKGDPETRSIPILMLTAKGVREQKVEGLGEIDEYYTKPFSPAKLVSIVRKLVGS